MATWKARKNFVMVHSLAVVGDRLWIRTFPTIILLMRSCRHKHRSLLHVRRLVH